MAFHVNYDSIAATYDRRYLENDYSGVERALMAFVGPNATGRVLEVGCGTGHWLRLLGESGMRVAGVDASGNMLSYARARALGAALAHGRAEHLPLRSQTFERVFCINAFHHFEDKVGFLSEAHRVLVPGGQVMTVGLDPHTATDRCTSTSTSSLHSQSTNVAIPHRIRFGNGCSHFSSRVCAHPRCNTCRLGFRRGQRLNRDVSARAPRPNSLF